MSAQVEQPPSAPVAGQDADSSKHGFVVSVIISSFSNSSQARDWLVILVIGGILEYIRRVFLSIWNSLVSQFSITITMEDFDESYCKPTLSPFYLAVSLRPLRLGDVVVVEATPMDPGQGDVH